MKYAIGMGIMGEIILENVKNYYWNNDSRLLIITFENNTTSHFCIDKIDYIAPLDNIAPPQPSDDEIEY